MPCNYSCSPSPSSCFFVSCCQASPFLPHHESHDPLRPHLQLSRSRRECELTGQIPALQGLPGSLTWMDVLRCQARCPHILPSHLPHHLCTKELQYGQRYTQVSAPLLPSLSCPKMSQATHPWKPRRLEGKRHQDNTRPHSHPTTPVLSQSPLTSSDTL